MLLAIILVILLVLLFGGLGLFIAKWLVIGLLLVALVSIIAGAMGHRA